MAAATSCFPSPTLPQLKTPFPFSRQIPTKSNRPQKALTTRPTSIHLLNPTPAIAALLGAGFALASTSAAFPDLAAYAAEFPSIPLNEPTNALSLPTWAIHVSSVVEWITAMVLVWQYGEKSGHDSWKGLSWGMVPLLGGAFCACTWHFFYNSESLEILVALQAALTVIGNLTMCIAAFRIYKSSQGDPENL
ncbi:uncharacterized protein LOC131248420 [Magnolia sinica]|uniref:uncharacterized protein LOC131248420 n=1 Tax=Magnolia sinica TaxID=86752 RepID=UPI0026592252|nr:uncharacterized protein LOC131248420 [Magnolia sinica]